MRLWHLQNQALQNLLLVTSPWCFFLAHPFLLLKSLIISFESARPPAFKCGNLFKFVMCFCTRVFLHVHVLQREVARSLKIRPLQKKQRCHVHHRTRDSTKKILRMWSPPKKAGAPVS